MEIISLKISLQICYMTPPGFMWQFMPVFFVEICCLEFLIIHVTLRTNPFLFHMTSLKFELQIYWSSWDFTLMMYKSSWELIFIQVFAPNGFLVLWYTTLEFLSFCMTRHPRELSWWLKKWVISGNLAIYTVHVSEKVLFYCFRVPRGINSRFCSKTQWKMFVLVSGRHVGAHTDGHQHCVSIQISISLGKNFSAYLA